jgi:hypothetical protein
VVVVDNVAVVEFVRAWIESAIVAESSELDCHVRIVIVFSFVDVVVVDVFVVDVVADVM